MLKTLPFSFFMLLYSPTLKSVEPSLLEEVNKCDAIFCPSESAASGSIRTSPHPEASANTGLNVQKVQATSIQVDPVILPTATKVFKSIPTQDMLQSSALSSPNQQSHLTAPQDIKSAARQKTQAPEFSPSNSGFRGGAPISGLQNTIASNPNLKNGLLYRDDENDSGTSSQNIKPLIQQNHFLNQNGIAATNKANKSVASSGEKNGQKRVQANQALFSGSSPTLSSPFGQFESPNNQSENSQNKINSGSNILMKIAGALGLDRFFATKGKSESSNLNQSKYGRGSTQGSITKDEPLKDPLTILQAQLDKHLKQKRSLASQLEFGSSQSSLFHSMCEHYKRYAQRARIPDSNTQPCPKP